MRYLTLLAIMSSLAYGKTFMHTANPKQGLKIANPEILSKIDERLPLYLFVKELGSEQYFVLKAGDPLADLYRSTRLGTGPWTMTSNFWHQNGLQELRTCLSKITWASKVLTGEENGNADQAWKEYVTCLEASDREVSLAFGRNDFLGKKLQPSVVPFLLMVRKTARGQARAAKLPSQRKTSYGNRDTFHPYHYTRIRTRCEGGAAIVRTSRGVSEVFASGALIGMNLVLTCAHDVENVPLKKLSVRFNYQVAGPGKQPGGQDFQVKKIVLGRPHDFAILEVGQVDSRSPGHNWPIQPLDAKPVEPGASLYVVGHPEGKPREVADNSFVLFPYRASLVQVGGMAGDVREELALYRGAWIQEKISSIPKELRTKEIAAKVEENVQKKCEALLSDFRNSYVKDPNNPGVFLHKSKRWDGRPSIGADADTYLGNSGSPVYSKVGHGVIGILLEGAPDSVKPLRPGWVYHERILPLAFVIEKIRSTYSDAADRGIIITGSPDEGPINGSK